MRGIDFKGLFPTEGSGKHSVHTTEEENVLPQRTKTILKTCRVLLEVILVAAVLLLYMYSFTDAFKKPDVTVTYYTPNGSFTQAGLYSGDVVELAEGPEIEGYTFIGWRDEEGQLETKSRVKVFENISFSAEYSFALETVEHVPYMLLSDGAYFRPNDLFTRGEAAIMIYRLLNTDKVGTGTFSDVEKTDACYTAAATLKELGVIGGSRFHPDDPVTLGELLDMLASFSPISSNSYAFADLDSSNDYYPAFCAAADRGWIKAGEDEIANPDSEMTRLEAAAFINSILGRSGDSDSDYAKCGTFFDVSFDDVNFWDAAEASLVHEYDSSSGMEKWTSGEGLELHEPGYFFVGVKLYYAEENGGVVTDREVDGLYYGPDGCYSSGDEELDEVVWSVLSEIVDPETMTREEMLRICFDYCVNNFEYKNCPHVKFGESGWGAGLALKMLSLNEGNCYYFAAGFWALARAIGYDAVLYSGMASKRPHGWVEIEFEDGPHIFDTEIQYIKPKQDMYNRTYEDMKGWFYTRADG